MRGRPTGSDSRARKARFLNLIADGYTPDAAVEESKVSHKKAIKIMSERDYLDVVRAIRDGAGPVIAIVEAPLTQQAA